MQYNFLGKSGLHISTFSLGSWLTFGKQISDPTARDLMAMAYERGVNFFDNAEAYAGGKSEEVMGRIFKQMDWDRSTYLVSSKVFWGGDKPNQKGLSRKHIFEACHAALRRLQVDYLDLFFCHRPDYDTPLEETVWAMNILLQQGKILYWGTSEWPADRIAQAHHIARANNLVGPTMEQPQYNMFHRDRVERQYLDLYELGLGTTIWSPLASGLLTGKYNDGIPEDKKSRLSDEDLSWLREKVMQGDRIEKVQKLTEIAGELGMSMTQLALAWCAKSPYVSTVILGARNEEQLSENLDTLDHLDKINPVIQERIDAILGNKPERESY